MYAHNGNIGRVRTDIEHKLSGEKIISLINFHELLCFKGQTNGREPEHFNNNDIKVGIGWNAWRLLCSQKRAEVIDDWIYEHLIRDESIAKKIRHFFRDVTDPW